MTVVNMNEVVIRQVEQFVYREARLLDERRFREWLKLFTEDIRYWMAQRTTRYPKVSKAIKLVDADRYDDDDLPHDGGLALYDENLDSLERRVARLETGLAWSEDPPSRTRRLITNIEVEPAGRESEIQVYANFLVYKNRAETEQDFFVGARKDLLRQVEGAWKIASRRLILDQTVILSKNVSIFF
jgi:3-phenylpropionate/cinnamic acid dioxygenase small subunit